MAWWRGGALGLKVNYHYTCLTAAFPGQPGYNNNNNNDRLTAFDPGQPG